MEISPRIFHFLVTNWPLPTHKCHKVGFLSSVRCLNADVDLVRVPADRRERISVFPTRLTQRDGGRQPSPGGHVGK